MATLEYLDKKVWEYEVKWGEIPATVPDETADIWDFAATEKKINFIPYSLQESTGLYCLAGGEKLYISSSSSLDAGKPITVKGLEGGTGRLIEVKDTLGGVSGTGTLKKEIGLGLGIDFFRLFRVSFDDKIDQVFTPGTERSNDPINNGELYVYRDSVETNGIPADTNLVQAVVLAGNNQTQMGVYTVPFNAKEAKLKLIYAFMDRRQASSAKFSLWTRNPGEGFKKLPSAGANTQGGNPFAQFSNADLRPGIDFIIQANTDASMTVSILFEIHTRFR